MKKKWTLLLLAGCLLLAAALIMGRRPVEDQLPPMLMMDGKLYRYASTSEGGPSSLPDGTIASFIGNRVPTQDGEYNFDAGEMPYWKYAEGICVYVKENGNYLLFEEAQIQE